MGEKWIGKEDDTSGSYRYTICSELSLRVGGYLNAKKLYRFNSRFGSEYNITDEEVVGNIDELISNNKQVELIEYLYNVVINRFGVLEFIVSIEHKIADERSQGYEKGKKQIQKEFRELLGLRV